jgi:hypothetical protein
MRITIENTSRVIEINGVPARVWEGKTDSGIAVHCAITRIAVHKTDDASQFEAELVETKPPSAAALECFPLRMVL